jgi:hypothetical protein
MNFKNIEKERNALYISNKKKTELGYILSSIGALFTSIFFIIIAKVGDKPVFTIVVSIGILSFLFGLILLLIAMIDKYHYQKKVVNLVKKEILSSLYSDVDFSDSGSLDLEPLINANLFSRPLKYVSKNIFKGVYLNNSFEVGEVFFQKKKNKSDSFVSYLKAKYIHLTLDSSLKGKATLQEAGFWSKENNSNLEIFKSNNEEFDLKFVVSASNKEIKDYLFNDSFINEILKLRNLAASKLCLALYDNELYILFIMNSAPTRLKLSTQLNDDNLRDLISNLSIIKEIVSAIEENEDLFPIKDK